MQKHHNSQILILEFIIFLTKQNLEKNVIHFKTQSTGEFNYLCHTKDAGMNNKQINFS